MDLGLEAIQADVHSEVFSEEILGYEKLYHDILIKKTAQKEATKNVLDLITTCGKTEQVEQYLKSTVSDFRDIDLKSYSKEELVKVLNDNLIQLDKDIDAAYEGWINNVIQKIKHTFTADSKVAKIISESIKKWEAVDPETFENKVIDFKLIKAEAIKKGIEYLSKIFKMLSEDAAALAEASKWFRGNLNKEQCQALIERLKRTEQQFLTKNLSLFDDLNRLLTHQRIKGKTYKEAGYTKATVVSILKQYSGNVAGLLKQIKDLTSLIWDVGAKLKVDIGFAVDTNGNVVPVLYIYKEVKKQFRELYGFAEDAYSKYLLIDYFMYRLAKEA